MEGKLLAVEAEVSFTNAMPKAKCLTRGKEYAYNAYLTVEMESPFWLPTHITD